MYVGLYAICVWNWNWWFTQDLFLIKHWSQRTHRCSAVRCWPWGIFIGAGQPLQHGEVRDTNLAWVRPVHVTTDQRSVMWPTLRSGFASGHREALVVVHRAICIDYICLEIVHRAQKSVPDSAGEWPTFSPPPLESCSGTANVDGPKLIYYQTGNLSNNKRMGSIKNVWRMRNTTEPG